MAEHPGIGLTVIRFIVKPESMEEIVEINIDDSSPSTKRWAEDEEFLAEFKQNSLKDDSAAYQERAVGNAADTISVLLELNCCNLFLVGRMPQGEVALDLSRNDCPELGPLGNLLTSPDFSTPASVLVVQQYNSRASPNFIIQMEEDLPDKEAESN